MTDNAKRLEALRQYHARRPTITRTKLTEALDRMETQTTVILKPPFKWTKTNLALEAGISIHTLISKDKVTGVCKFADILARFNLLKGKKLKVRNSDEEKDEKIHELREENNQLKIDKVNLALQLDGMGILLLEEREKVAKLSAVEQQNAQLREEARRSKYYGPREV